MDGGEGIAGQARDDDKTIAMTINKLEEILWVRLGLIWKEVCILG